MKIVIAGSSGLAGSAIFEHFSKKELECIKLDSSVVDLRKREATIEWFNKTKPNYVINAAAKVGGIGANSRYPVEFLIENLTIQNNVCEASFLSGVEKFVFLGSSCIYPKEAQQPIKENYLLTGKLEPTNSAYAIAKISGIELVNSYRKEYGKNWISLMPTNLYGPRDNFDMETAHVLPALISKFIRAKNNQSKEVELWGTGSPLREFLYVSDLASAVEVALENYNEPMPLNVGSGEEISIVDLAYLIADKVGYKGEIVWDSNFPNGTPRKLLDSSRIHQLGWKPKVTLEEGITSTIAWYRLSKWMEKI